MKKLLTMKYYSEEICRQYPDAIFIFGDNLIGKGHGGQKRAFKVKFQGEGVNDYGGPYRAVFEQVI